MASCSRRITCGPIRSTTAASAAENPTRPRIPSADRATRRAATMMFGRYSISRPFTSLPFGAGKRHLSSPGIARAILGGWTAERNRNVRKPGFRSTSLSIVRTDLCRGICDQRGGTAELCIWSFADSAGWIDAAAMDQPGRVFHACIRNVRQSGPQCISCARIFRKWSWAFEGRPHHRTRQHSTSGRRVQRFQSRSIRSAECRRFVKATSASSPPRSATMRPGVARRESFSFQRRYRSNILARFDLRPQADRSGSTHLNSSPPFVRTMTLRFRQAHG